MPIRPFPYPFRIGADICHVPRLVDLITQGSRHGLHPRVVFNRFLRRILTAEERMIYHARWPAKEDDISDSMTIRIAQHLAGRWAAKEAVIKAVKPRKLTLHQIIVFSGNRKVIDNDNETYAVILDRPPPPEPSQETNEQELEGGYSPVKDFDELDGQIVRLSISHDGDYAYAVCMAPTMPEPGDVGGEAAAREDENYKRQQGRGRAPEL